MVEVKAIRVPFRLLQPCAAPRWLRYLVAVPLILAWLVFTNAAVGAALLLALFLDSGVLVPVVCGVVVLAAATACTWFLVDGLVGWAEGGAS